MIPAVNCCCNLGLPSTYVLYAGEVPVEILRLLLLDLVVNELLALFNARGIMLV